MERKEIEEKKNSNQICKNFQNVVRIHEINVFVNILQLMFVSSKTSDS